MKGVFTMAIAEEKKRVAVTLSKETLEQLNALLKEYQENNVGRVTVSDVVADLIKKEQSK